MLFLLFFFVLQRIAFITLYERHLLGLSQNRLGPSKVGYYGLIQAIVDGIKLLTKEQVLPLKSSYVSFLFIPSISFIVIFLD